MEVARFRRGSFPQPYGNSEWYDGDGAMPFVQVADVTDEMNLVGDTKQKISRKAQPLSVFAEEGSVLVTLQGSIGRVAITQYGAFIDRTVLIFEKFNLPVDNLFWAYIIKQKFIEEAKCAPGGTIKTITKEVLSDFDIKLPSHPEQETIGTFFSSLDRHITLHQRKLDKLKSVKQAYLSEIFPAEGERVPKRRFPGFTDAWELRRFSELAEIRRGLTYSPVNIRLEGIRVLRSSNIDEDTFTFGEDDVFVDKGVVKSPLVKEGDILITAANGSSRLVGKHTIIKDLPENSAIHGGFMLLASCRNPEFINSLMSSAWYTKFINLYVAGGNGAIGNLNKHDLDEQNVLVPSQKEQSAIGTFFSTLDQQITLHQRKSI